MDIVADKILVQLLGAVIDEVAAGLYVGDVLGHTLRIHAKHDVNAFAPTEIAFLAHPHLVPGGQSLNIGGENIFGRYRDAHTEDGLGKHVVCAGRTGAIYVGEANYEVVEHCILEMSD